MAALAWLALVTVGEARAQTGAEPARPGVLVAPGEIAVALEPLAEGAAELVRARLGRLGVTVLSGKASRAALAGARRTAQARVESARRLGAAGVVLVDLGVVKTQGELRLRYYASSTAALLALGRGRGPASDWAALCASAAEPLAPALGFESTPLSPEPAVSTDQLAALGGALLALDGGEVARAWRELGAWPAGPLLEALRERIRETARAPGAPYEERPRLLAAMGELESAWSMLAQRAEVELEQEKPNAELLLAAGELALERGEREVAATYLERALALGPAGARLELALGRLRALEGEHEEARDAFERARALLPAEQQLEPLERIAELPLGTPQERAQGWLRAGELAARELRVSRARALLAHVREPDVEPELQVQSLQVEASLAASLGDPSAAQAWTQALEVGGRTPDRLLALGESLRQHGELERAGQAFEEALVLAPQRADVVGSLGELELERGSRERANELLERAIQLEPKDTRSLRALGRMRQTAGEGPLALDLYRRAAALEPGDAEALQELALLEVAHGTPAAARHALEQAVELAPWDPEPRAALSRALREQGDVEGARAQGELVLVIGGAHYSGLLDDMPGGAAKAEVSASLERMTANLLRATPGVRRVSAIGLREQRSRSERWLDWLRPRVPDHSAVAAEIERALGASIELVPAREPPGQELYYQQAVAALYAFENPAAVDAPTIAGLNGMLDSDAVLLARLERHGADPSALERPCGIEAHYLIDARLLAGRSAPEVKAAQSRGCLIDAGARFARWNWPALALYLGALLALSYPFLRGWGKVVVLFKIPDHTRAMLSVSVTARRRRTDEEVVTEEARWRIKETLQLIKHRSEKRLHGSSVAFPFLAARQRPYFVTVRGPLLDQHSNELLGSFAAEKTVVVRRGQTAEVEFDMTAKEACIEVSVVASGARVAEAQICLRGDPKSQRFLRGAPGYLYLAPGEYVLVAGVDDAVSEVELVVERELPMKVALDVRDPASEVFRGCRAAVSLYLDGDFARAASELERAGLRESASKVRALAQLARGESAAAEASLAQSGELARAGELALERGSAAQAAAHFEGAGEHLRAGEAHLRQGDPHAAARAFERAYEYERAASCYRELGDLESLARVLERSGDLYEAGRIACALEQWDRAIENLGQVEARHPHYTETCLILGEILYERGERDLALERFDEAIRRASADGIELGQQARYAELLEEAGRIAEAIEVYNRIRRRDRNYPGARERVEALRLKLTDASRTRVEGAGASGASSSSGARSMESRYEILGELGRGAMGIVYKARDRVLDRLVALKKLPESMRSNELAVRFFLREARSAAALNHPNIVTVYDAGQEGEEYFLTMECLEGTTFEAILRRQRVLSARDTAVLGVQAASGLAYAHGNGIIHRDIKPANLFYTQERVVKIMDFGLAKAVEEVRRSATVIAGTPYYMPPEQAAGGVVDRRSDLYALGVTLFHLSTGSVPFPDGDVAYHHRHTPPPDPRERVASLPDALAELIAQLLEKEPDARPQAAEEVATRLRAIAAALTASASATRS